MMVLVIGGGPAGMMAAIAAAQHGADVTLLEKNEKLGKKLYITGKGRCNVTTTDEGEAFFAQVARNPRFLYSSLNRFGPQALRVFLEERGVPLKEERGGRVFPASDKASDITRALESEMRRLGVTVRLRTPVRELLVSGGVVTGLVLGDGAEMAADAVIVATGGLSYPATGSTGDGLRWAERLQLQVVQPRPSLVQLHTSDAWAHELAGITLKNVTLEARAGKRRFFELGEMLFTHTGISGPLALSLSARLDLPFDELSIDSKPGLTPTQLDARLLRDATALARKQVTALMAGLTPIRLGTALLDLLGWREDMPVHQITKEMRLQLSALLKRIPLHATGLGGMAEAIITRGGVAVSCLDPSCMAVKTCAGLYFAGEVIDVDAVTGGYNLQIAFSTGYAAGVDAAQTR